MFKKLIIIILILFSSKIFANEELLTVQQQLDRLQREVNDLTKSVYSNSSQNSEESNEYITNFSAIDMRIYDLEKDVKNLTSNIEDLFFQLEDIFQKINSIEQTILDFENNISKIKSKSNNQIETGENLESQDENSLGTLKITSENSIEVDTNENQEEENVSLNDDSLSVEDQFQAAFDNIRNKNWDQAKKSFENFIENNSDDQLSGSAHYWLGELYILEKKFRDAALIFAEGYQKFPESIKAPDMLFKLSQSLYEVGKKEESCKTIDKLLNDYPDGKFSQKAKKQIVDYECFENEE